MTECREEFPYVWKDGKVIENPCTGMVVEQWSGIKCSTCGESFCY